MSLFFRKHTPKLIGGLVFALFLSGIVWAIASAVRTEPGPMPASSVSADSVPVQTPVSRGFTRTESDKGVSVVPDADTSFRMTLPESLSDPIDIAVSGDRHVTMLQSGGSDFGRIPESAVSETAGNGILLSAIRTDPILSAYRSADVRKTSFYSYREPDREKKTFLFKHWTLYDTPASGGEHESYAIGNAHVSIGTDGDARVYQGDGSDIGARDPDFLVPRPYYLDRNGSKTDLDWTFDPATKTLSVSFSAPASAYPIALDPSVLQTDAVIAKFSGRTVSMFSCGSSTVQDADGNTYATVPVGSQCWMATNLNVGTMLASGPTMPTNNATIEKWCYNNTASSCTTYGGLYEWNEAMGYSTTAGAQGICPAGWHIPNDAEQYALENRFATGTCSSSRNGLWDCDPAGTALKAGGVSGLNFPLAGTRDTDGSFYSLGSDTYIWSSSVSGSNAWRRYLYSGSSTVVRYTNSQSYGWSVRCVKD